MRTKGSGVHPIDVHVGSQTRARRRFLGLSLEALAQRLGLTFQQVQKYENGSNRISASRLHDMAKALQVPISYFYDGCDSHLGDQSFVNSAAERAVNAFITTREGLELAEYFPRIPVGPQRRKLLDLVRALADG